jgi:malonyl-CoA O-methyltransferase
MNSRKQRIAARFGASTPHYDAGTPVQREVAQRLAERIKRLSLPQPLRVLEIGCGTGHLTLALAPAIGGDWLITDIAPDMVAECARRCASAGVAARFAVMDGEQPEMATGATDLIVSSLAAQWFEDLPGAVHRLSRLLAPGGRIILATLGEGSFMEWRAAHAALGFAAATPHYPDATRLARSFPPGMRVSVAEETLREPFAEPLDFLRRLRAIGADTPAADTRPLSAGQLRRVIRKLEQQGATAISYRVLYATAERSA